MYAANMIHKDYLKFAEKYPRQLKAIEEYMRSIAEYENSNETNIDLVAGLTGEMLGEVFAWKEDEWYHELKTLGYYMGKFIYLMDAYEDMEKDDKKGNYNPFLLMRGQVKNEDLAEHSLNMMAAGAAEHFERLPLVENLEILRNILYAGVWGKFEKIKAKREKEEK
jgi:hypothetical protein